VPNRCEETPSEEFDIKEVPDIVDKLEADLLIVTSAEEFVESDSAKLMSAKEDESVVMTSFILIF